MSKTIAVIGTGLMGAPMARNLLAGGYTVHAWNRTRAKAEAIDDATVCDTVPEAVAGADFVLTMLSDGPAVDGYIFDTAVTDAMANGATWLDMSSAKPEEARRQAAHLASLGFGHLDAPVSGGTKGAEGASLAIMVGGDAATFAKAEPVFDAMGRPVHVGPSGSGQLSKLANQAIVAVTIGAVAEATLLLEKGGADPTAVRAALKGGFADSVILQQHGARMSDRNWVPGGLSKFQVKDLDNLLAEAGGLDIHLPVAQHVRDRFQRFVADMEGGDLDHSGLFLELLDQNGLKP
ncbi:NAD(P)-dependent oxidoreductase [Actibacterium sp. 188UL27-1]|uniref:NAD(P)-dependent oxidoreductase n=1 Tax=Actibacterium sp. 188UL27-1 TaxID=2786961 RepID=UPI00195B570F|nr:NAD(P)-dependent oxidoreductase [Actibacterium sp. 188UL27-1]MBM7066831.1 NAD(P)-dependent oxidoreductase [Actibacterium sp. 188UL27-1]